MSYDDAEFEAWLIARVEEREQDRAATVAGTEDRFVKAAKKVEAADILREWRKRKT